MSAAYGKHRNVFFCNVTISNYIIFCLRETCLCCDVGSSDYFPLSFVVHRGEGDFSARDTTGAGVLVAADWRFRFTRREDLEKIPESLCVEMECTKTLDETFAVWQLHLET